MKQCERLAIEASDFLGLPHPDIKPCMCGYPPEYHIEATWTIRGRQAVLWITDAGLDGGIGDACVNNHKELGIAGVLSAVMRKE